MITRLGAEEGAEVPKKSKSSKAKTVGTTHATVTHRGSRFGQVVEVVSTSRGQSICVDEHGSRFQMAETFLSPTKKSRKKK